MHTTTVPTHLRTDATTHPDGPPTPTGRWPESACAAVSALTYVIGFVLLGAYLARRASRRRGRPGGRPRVPPRPPGRALRLARRALPPRRRLARPARDGAAGPAPTGRARGGRARRAGHHLVGPAVQAAGMVALVGQQAVVHLHGTDPAQATSAWTTVRIVQDALGGGIELVGGLLILAVAWAGLRSGRLPCGPAAWARGGVAGALTSSPPRPGGGRAGLGTIAWFAWTAVELRRQEPVRRPPPPRLGRRRGGGDRGPRRRQALGPPWRSAASCTVARRHGLLGPTAPGRCRCWA
ncbi:MAG: hypothetical protein R2711_12650 [Acidimicrobiales bacterium]